MNTIGGVKKVSRPRWWRSGRASRASTARRRRRSRRTCSPTPASRSAGTRCSPISTGRPTPCSASRTLPGSPGITDSGASRRIEQMIKAGLIDRHSCPADRRGVYAHLTEKGKAAYEKAYAVFVRSLRTEPGQPPGAGRGGRCSRRPVAALAGARQLASALFARFSSRVPNSLDTCGPIIPPITGPQEAL